MHIDHTTCDICSNRPHLCTACMHCGLKTQEAKAKLNQQSLVRTACMHVPNTVYNCDTQYSMEQFSSSFLLSTVHRVEKDCDCQIAPFHLHCTKCNKNSVPTSQVPWHMCYYSIQKVDSHDKLMMLTKQHITNHTENLVCGDHVAGLWHVCRQRILLSTCQLSL